MSILGKVCRRRLVLVPLLAVCILHSPAAGQIRDELRFFAHDASNGYAESLMRFSRKLKVIGVTSVEGLGGILATGTPHVLDGLGRSWIAFDPLNTTQLLRVDRDGVVLDSAWLSHNPVNVVVDSSGRAYASTRIGLSSPGPMYGVDADGGVFWSNAAGPALYNNGYPQQLAMTATGEVWLGDGFKVGFQEFVPVMVRLDPASGAVLDTLQLVGNAGVCGFGPSGDGTLWAFACGGPYRWLFKTQGTQVLTSFPISGGYNGNNHYTFHVDAFDRPHVLSLPSDGGGSKILRYDPAAPAAPDASWQFGGTITGWCFGPSGEEIFALISPASDPLTRRLERMNLVTKTKSSVPLNPTWTTNEMPRGDHTGFLYANVIDRGGDNDGDGAPNGVETGAGSNPFDPLSRPEGPRVYLSFAPGTNAIVLKYVDPDGLLDPAGGLDLASLELLTGAGTNVFNFVLPFLTTVDVTPDGTQATAAFGALPLPDNLEIRLEARVSDLTGAVGWDWQATPPGDL